MNTHFRLTWRSAMLVLTSILCLASLPVRAQEELDIDKVGGGTKRFPVAVIGYSGEAASVLRFDLEIAGMELVNEEQAQFVLRGANDGQVEGRLTDAINKATLVAKSYSGGNTRSQAHALADDVVAAITKVPGIARTKIAFKVHQGSTSEIYVSDYDGRNAVAITKDNSIVAAPCWVPGQRRLYYTTYKYGNPDIIVHDLNSGNRTLVARYSGLNTSAAASPDGSMLAMILSKGGSPDVYVAQADGSQLRQVTKTRDDESSPCWSPDGRTLLFAARIDGRRVLAKAPAGGGAMQRLSLGGVSNPSEPDWSPDGKWIVFTAQMGGFEICVVPAKGGEAKVLVSGEDPSWAPNSRNVVFTRRLGGGRRVVSLLDVQTKQVKDVLPVSGACSQPAWAR